MTYMWILGKQTQIEKLDLLKCLNNKSNFFQLN